jgi:cytochrome c peroxidase
MNIAYRLFSCLSAALLFTSIACSTAEPTAPGGQRRQALGAEPGLPSDRAPAYGDPDGRALFENPFHGTNGRSCATCHVLDEDTALLPASVEARLAADPTDPLFRRIDADDPEAEVPTYEHLKKGLVRVVLPLADNVDIVDLAGEVITRPDRTIFVWRGVPTVANTAITAPYQLDRREPDLQSQAQKAITSHSEGPEVTRAELDAIAAFQQGVFTSPRAQFVSALLDLGVPLDEIPEPEAHMPLDEAEKRGRVVYNAACQACHGSATTDRIVNREAQALFFVDLKRDGNVRFDLIPGVGPVPVFVSRPDAAAVNAGFGTFSYLGQVGLFPSFTSTVELPRYRLRFYKDGTRQEVVTDLPPIPVTASGDPLDLNPALDENGAPIVGPNFLPQLFTTDPGRAAITGDPYDFEAFDVPQLRGIARTAPYFHDNSHASLKDAVDTYSRFIVGVIAPLGLPPVNPPEGPGLPPEALSPDQKRDLLAFLARL